MKRFTVILLLIIFSLPLYSSICEEGQIDINSASAEKLTEIIWIGEKTGEYLIDARPFNSIDDLINVKYIGDSKLSDIKEQKLACVDKENSSDEYEEQENEQNEDKQEEDEFEENEEQNKEKDKSEKDEKSSDYNYLKTDSEKNQIKNLTLNPINLNIKDIKDKNKENPNWALYGIMIFCVLLGFLFIERKRRSNKNEFR
jgi:hypothetical protein